MQNSLAPTWLVGPVLVLAAAVLLGTIVNHNVERVNTEDMLDVSLSVKSVSNVTTDEVGDSVWGHQAGSGFLISRQGCEVLTNHHVVKDAAMIEVFPRGWGRARGIPATLLNGSPRFDIALLKMEHCEAVAGEARFADSSLLRQGDEAYAVGNPLGRNPDTISRGIVSHTERFIGDPVRYIQTDAIIGPGSSGGALFNRFGEVIGVNSGIANSSSGVLLGVSYAIPINKALSVIEQLRKGDPVWGYAGFEDHLTELSPLQAAVFGVPEQLAAVGLVKTPEVGPAANLLQARDVIYRIDGKALNGVSRLKQMIGARQPGEQLTLEIARDGKPHTLSLTLVNGWRPDQRSHAERYRGYLGMTMEMWGKDSVVSKQFESPVIVRVQGLGPAHRSRISSSQHNFIYYGGMAMRRVFDVRTVTGVVYQGQYHAVRSVEEVEGWARQASEENSSMLLEVEHWKRQQPRLFSSELEYEDTRYYHIYPARFDGARTGTMLGRR